MLRATAIMKTDIQGSTPRFRMLPETDLQAVLTEHRQFVSRLAKAHDGRIAKAEGDGYFVVFPSVTAAALAAMSMQEELRHGQPDKGDARIKMRIAITLGDVLEQDGGLVGDAVVLAARIEALTPPDEIYVPASAWQAANKGQLSAALVDTFTLKSFPEPVAVYRIEQTHRIREMAEQYIVVTDLHGFGAFAAQSPMSLVARILDHDLELMRRVCAEFSGSHRSTSGDSYLLTFPDAARALGAVERLAEEWTAFQRQEGVQCSLKMAVHKGTLYAFRAFLLGGDINLAFHVESATKRLEPGVTSIYVTGPVQKDLAGTVWGERLRLVDMGPRTPRLADLEIYRLDR
ncbi:MAG TPA: adenylate/guanylate cyclase domain-containing protein [Methylomirabilota bacterium]|jgi:class 3 adenylate cyclase|nr:adenylate/guanylate cyclase domain-containing protein [Methylomirabilota bacterium]